MSVARKPSPYFWTMTVVVVVIAGMIGLAALVF